MNDTIPDAAPSNELQTAIEGECDSDSRPVFTLSRVVLLVCGGTITGRSEVTMIGLGLII